ncbi:MAG: transcriptional activator NhaR [Pseudomonadaceae bacterium]|nr:transcriptional activator NhaR [Pseudomonadaceae bacterium]
MRHLNYNHLLYFWTVAREGSIARASEALYLTPQTISGQIKLLEQSVGEPLFQRVGRGLALTDSGRVVYQYADEIFTLGAELTQRVKSKEPGVPVAVNVGIVNSIAKLIAYRIVEPALQLDDPIRVVCYEGDLEKLLGDLAVHRLDMVISDRPIPTGLNVKAYNHALGESGISFFASKKIASKYERRFPQSLDKAPLLLPVNSSALRRSLDDFFERIDVTPNVVAEFDDSALLKAFGEAGAGVFPAPTAIAEEISQMYRAKPIGDVEGVSETYYAISPERKIKHPAVRCVTEMARESLFA